MTIAFVFAGLDSADTGGTNFTDNQFGDTAPGLVACKEHDVLLVQEIRGGSHDAFAKMFLDNYDSLCRFAESYVRNPSDAEEIVEGVLARIWEHKESFDPKGGVAPYLYSAVRNRSLNLLRDNKARYSWEAAHTEDMAYDTGHGRSWSIASSIAELEREELGAVLRRVIETLPEHRRAVVTMRWFGGLSHAEVASALGTSVNAVEIQLRRALKELATKIPKHLRE